ncbi:MAG: hypothetical protein IPO66_10090 [Rhodanobacteraceae bacterium]|nr:hypothetical protein [Rhodanobacteraceae bacterium]
MNRRPTGWTGRILIMGLGFLVSSCDSSQGESMKQPADTASASLSIPADLICRIWMDSPAASAMASPWSRLISDRR